MLQSFYMKKLLATLCLLGLVGAGCTSSKEPVTNNPENTDSTSTNQETQTPTTPNPTPTPSPAPAPAEEQEEVSESNGLQSFPTATPPATPINDSTWTQTVTRTGVTITAPTTGTYAPTWTYTVLPANDVKIVDKCYVTSDVVYKQSNSPTEGYCHTATAFDENAGTRTDYFLAVGTTRTDLWTFTKTYPAGFNHNDYNATLNHIIGILD